jgi:hypothetical protein
MIISPMLGGIVYEKSGKLVDLAIMISIGAFGIILRLLTNEPPRTTASVSTIINTVETARKKDEKFRLQVNITIISVSPSSDRDTASTLPSSQTPLIGRLPGILTLLRSPQLLGALYDVFINECLVASLYAILQLFVHLIFS